MKRFLFTTVFLCINTLFYAQTPEIGIELFASGLTQPLDIQNMGDDRLFVVEQGGDIMIVQNDGTVNPTPFLDITVTSGAERGLLGMAFHPEYATNGFFFVNYTNPSGDTRISRFTVSPDNPDIANPNSEFIILEVDQPFSNHNAGGLAFGSDGFLYCTMGDGGSGGDPGNRAQNTNILLGKILRIDVDNQDAGLNYSIPDTNPFVGVAGFREEIWHYGLRNPFRISFDPETGGMWIGDVGQNAVEEIDFSLEGGANFGWRCYEGNSPFNTSGCPDPSELTFPVAQYQQTSLRRSIVGGHVYRGSEFPSLQGLYIFADTISNEIIYTDASNPGDLVFSESFGGNNFVSFGVDQDNELYTAGIGSGSIFRVVDLAALSIDEATLSLATLYPNPAQGEVVFEYPAFAKAEQLHIYNLNGKLVQSESIQSVTTTFSVAQLSTGMYMARLGSNSQTIKLVVQ